MTAVIKKELKNYFFSPIGYIIIGIFLVVFSAFFYYTTISYSEVDLTNLFYCVAMYGIMFMIPLLTMWSISGERKNGTEQLIMTSPVSMLGVVMAKFIAAMLFIIIPVIFTLMYFFILNQYQTPDIPTYLTSILGFILLSMSYIAFGIFVSSLTESSIISAILSFAFIFIVTWLPIFFSGLSVVSFIDPYINFLYGQIDISAIIMFVTFTILCLLLTMIVMQRRKSIK